MLVDLEPQLRRRGVHVPLAGRNGARSARHAQLKRALDRGKPGPEQGPWRQLLEEIRASDARQFVISDESFSQRPQPQIAKAIAEVARLASLDVDIVGYVRPQWQYIEARYAQMVKHGWGWSPFERFVAETLMRAAVRGHAWLDYGSVFAPWREALGDSDHLTILPLEPSRPADGLVAHFLGLLGAGDLAWADQRRYNTRLGAKQVEVRRLTATALSRHVPPSGIPPMMKRLDDLPTLLGPDAPFAGLSQVRALELMEYLGPANAAFADEYGLDADGVLFRDAVADSLVRPNVAQWHHFQAHEQRAVREYVQRTVGVDPMPQSRRRATPARTATARLGSPRWLTAWLTDPRFLLWVCGRLAGWLLRVWGDRRRRPFRVHSPAGRSPRRSGRATAGGCGCSSPGRAAADAGPPSPRRDANRSSC